MMDGSGRPLSREETELIAFFRGLPLQERMDVLDAAESRFNALQRMKQLAARQVETDSADAVAEGWRRH